MSGAIVIGGGIGGLTAAVALHRKGIDARVYENAPELRPVGKGIWVPTNAMQVLDRLGLAGAVAAAGWPLRTLRARTKTTVFSDLDLAPYEAKYGFTTYSIHRAALVECLAAALPPGVLRLGKQFTGLEHDGDRVTARFADGTTDTGDVLVGADGLKSAVREFVRPGVQLRYSGQACYRGVGALDLPADLERVCWEVWGGESRFGFSPIGKGRVYWFAPVTAAAGGPGDSAEQLAARYAGFPDPIPAILRATPADDIIRTDLYDFPPIRGWSKGRVVLVGDAAHAMTPNLGQGGAQAIEDAYVLADRLAAGGPPEQAFRDYERSRTAKVRWIVKTAWRIGRVAHLRGRWSVAVRDLVFRNLPGWINRQQFDRLYALGY